jgi:hypothetical protein
MDHFTETTRTGYGSNIGNSFKGILFGFLLIIISIVLLWYNESRSVKQATALKEMQSKIITLPDTKYKQEYNNQPILIQGEVKPVNIVKDTTFGVVSDGLLLQRDVTMYQWEEQTSSHSEDKLGGSTETITTYDYYKGWHSHPQNSSSFKHPSGHENPPMSYHSQLFSTDATIGDFHISKSIINKFNISSSFDGLNKMPDNIGEAKNYKQFLYIGGNPQSPNIGDIKISYRYTPLGIYSIATKAENRELVDYTTDNGRKFTFIKNGKVSANQIFKDELDSNSLLTWLFRAGGLILMFVGFKLIMGPLSALANIIPMFGSLVSGASSLVALVFTLILGSIIISIAWFASRPIMSLVIIGGAILISMVFSKSRTTREIQDSTPPPTSSTPPVSRRDSSVPPPSRRDPSTPPPRR